MNLVIDASNIRSGGGLTHLVEILSTEQPIKQDFENVFLWASDDTLLNFPNHDWLIKSSHPLLNGSYFSRWRWRNLILEPFIKKKNALLFIPGTGYSRLPYVTMCQNLLPLDKPELNRYFFSKVWIRLRILRLLHLKSYKKASGIIYFNQYCKNIVEKNCTANKRYRIIRHGLSKRFLNETSKPYPGKFTQNRPFKLIYVSVVDLYKHQWVVAQAVYNLLERGYQITLDLVGPSYPPAMKKLTLILDAHKSESRVNYLGKLPHEDIHHKYAEADAFIFASTCETYGMVITEAMAAGLPVICSDYSSMPETVGDTGIYFKPLNIPDIEKAILLLYSDPKYRQDLSERSQVKAQTLSWETCAQETFYFLKTVSESLCAE